jgi:hypothetical protein
VLGVPIVCTIVSGDTDKYKLNDLLMHREGCIEGTQPAGDRLDKG